MFEAQWHSLTNNIILPSLAGRNRNPIGPWFAQACTGCRWNTGLKLGHDPAYHILYSSCSPIVLISHKSLDGPHQTTKQNHCQLSWRGKNAGVKAFVMIFLDERLGLHLCICLRVTIVTHNPWWPCRPRSIKHKCPLDMIDVNASLNPDANQWSVSSQSMYLNAEVLYFFVFSMFLFCILVWCVSVFLCALLPVSQPASLWPLVPRPPSIHTAD